MIHDLEEAARLNKGEGFTFFDEDNMAFWRTKIGTFFPVKHGAFFTASEKPDSQYPRRHTVFMISDCTGRVMTIGDRFEFATKKQADAKAKKLQVATRALETPDGGDAECP